MKISTTNGLSRWAGLFGLTFAVVLTASVAAFSQATVPPMGSAANFGILAQAGITGTSVVIGNVGSTGSTIDGTITAPGYTVYPINDPVVQTAMGDLLTAYNDAAGQSTGAVTLPAGALTGTLSPGIYVLSAATPNLATTVTLDGGGDPNAVFLFQASSTLITAISSSVVLTNGTVWSNVFWQVGSSATIGGSSTFEGTILANTSITVGASATITGRMLGGAVTGTGAVSISSNVLPVEMVSFTASTSGLNAQLHWSTATEVNNYGFEIQRRSAESESIGQWLKVGFVPGVGSSSSPHQYSYADQGLAQGRYDYRIKQIDKNGSFKYSSAAQVEVGIAPKEFTLSQSYPNPFNPSTTVEFSVARNDRAVVRVFNVLGQEVATLFDGTAEAGKLYQARFDASRMSSGMYFVQLQSNGQSKMQKMVFLK
jgi:hypothetical protein